MNVGGFFKHQNKTSDTNRYKRYFFTARTSQINVSTMKGIFQQRSELQVAEFLIVQVLFSSCGVSNLQLRNKRKTTLQCKLRVTNDIELNQTRVYHERKYADNVVSKFWSVRSFSSQHYSKFVANITSENVSQILSRECETRSFICKVNLISLQSSRHFNCDTVFNVIVSFLNESVHGFNNIRNWRVKARFQIVEFSRISNFFVKKHKFAP